MSDKQCGTVFNIQRYSVHDGPGIRTLVFLKGCPLRCLWCSNPESQEAAPQLAYNVDKCLGCGRCVAACPQQALHLTPEGICREKNRCDPDCRVCADICPGQALTFYGRTMTAREVLDKVEEDAAFYARSGGGLTLSGGEPLQQRDFCLSILDEAEHRAIHAAMESCGQAPEEVILAACGKLDYLLFDIKHLDSRAHRQATGMGNEHILRNLAAVRSTYPHLPVHIRTPLIPGINDNEEIIRRILELAQSMHAVHYELLPYHRMGEQKYRFLGREYPYTGPAQLESGTLDRLRAIVEQVYPGE